MILIKNKEQITDIACIKDQQVNGNLSILLQHTLTKQITVLQTVEDVGNKFNFIFENLDFSNYDDGEYYMVLLENPQNVEINTNLNNPKKASGQVTTYIYVTLNGDYISNADFFIVNGSTKVEKELKPVCTELMRIGEYKSPKTQYNSTKQYIQYGK